MNDPWGPIDMRNWQDVPTVIGRLATESDVAEGRAVFYLEESGASGAQPHAVALPACIIVRAEGSSEEVPCVAIQAEDFDGKTVAIGYRILTGGNGIATLPEVEFLASPDVRFVSG